MQELDIGGTAISSFLPPLFVLNVGSDVQMVNSFVYIHLSAHLRAVTSTPTVGGGPWNIDIQRQIMRGARDTAFPTFLYDALSVLQSMLCRPTLCLPS